MRRAQVDHAPGFSRQAGQPQGFEPFIAKLPTLGNALVAPAEELVTLVAIEPDGKLQPGIVIAAKETDLPPLALMFRPTREQARRLAMTLLAFAEGRQSDLIAASRQ